MSHFGILCPPVPGHLNPMCALGRTLRRRGHRVTVFQIEDLDAVVQGESLEFGALRDPQMPPGSLNEFVAKLASLRGIESLRFAIKGACRMSRLLLEQAPKAVRAAGCDALLVDQNEPAGGTVAEHLRLPFISVCTSLPLNRESLIPPPFVGWQVANSWLTRTRNQIAYSISDLFIRPIHETLNRYRESWKLPLLKTPDDSFSRLAQIAQMPIEFDFPRARLPGTFRYCGPWFDNSSPQVAFPFEKLDGRPLIYASLGTLQERDHHYFHVIAQSCVGLNAQLVMSLGAKNSMPPSTMPGNPIVVNYAPQLELLSRAAATVTHGGMNTTQQSLYFGVPLVAVPLTHDQPAIAARLARTGAGIVISQKQIEPLRLRAALRSILPSDSSYRLNALRMQKASRSAGGSEKAADVIESVLPRGLYHAAAV